MTTTQKKNQQNKQAPPGAKSVKNAPKGERERLLRLNNLINSIMTSKQNKQDLIVNEVRNMYGNGRAEFFKRSIVYALAASADYHMNNDSEPADDDIHMNLATMYDHITSMEDMTGAIEGLENQERSLKDAD